MPLPSLILAHMNINNTIPIITTIAISNVDEDEPNTYIVNADYPDTYEIFRYSLSTGPLFLSTDSATSEITVLADNDDIDSHPVIVVVINLNGTTYAQPFTLAVNEIKNAPRISKEHTKIDY
ncbi:MAG: hypothetical protein E2O86_03410 [Bacteroidetes bacterium]|nr:MAG: hypothetical protein E2O86_03410 [Bacteroidota bacterium]